ncbi:MAG: NitT/TauT family transport system permease protein [Candidatus Azotimanducaceae bacterium]|jgi:NitT/TauT family transport system permease protein
MTGNPSHPAPLSKLMRLVAPALALLGLLVLWEGSVYFLSIDSFLLPAPSAVGAEMVNSAGNLMFHTLFTLRTFASGFGLSILVALPLGLLIASSRLLEAALYPALLIIQSIPKVAMAPILIVAMGTSEAPRVAITFLVAFFPIVIATATGLLQTPTDLGRLAKSMNASALQTLFFIRLPCAVPYIFSGLKVSATLAVIGVVVAEFVAADRGLGYLLTSAMAFFNTPLAYAAMVLLSLMSVAAFHSIGLLQKLLFPWSVGKQAQAM